MLSSERILQIGLGFGASETLLSALEVGLFTELGKGPRSASQLRRALGLSEQAASDFLDVLVALRLLEREGSGRDAIYLNTRESSLFLDSNSPEYIGRHLSEHVARVRRLRRRRR